MDLSKIGLFIKELRKENKMSQQNLADMIPIDRTGLSKWENGETIPLFGSPNKMFCVKFHAACAAIGSQMLSQ